MKIIHRKDNTFVIEKNGFPFHLTEDYEEYKEILKKYENNGEDFEEEKGYEITLDDLKQEKLLILKEKVENYFYFFYPLHKQNNLAIYGSDEEKQKFKLFHDAVVKKYDDAVEKIMMCVDIEELESVEVDEGFGF